MKKILISPIIHVVKKLTVLDWVVVVILLGVFGFFLLNRFSKQEQWITVRLKVANDEWWWEGNAPQSWYGSGIANGQGAYNTFGKKVAEVQSIENYDQGGASRLIYANLKLLTTLDKKTHVYTFNYQPLEIGKPLDFTFGRYNLHGLVIDMGENGIRYTSSRIDVKLFGVLPWQADAFKEGFQMKDNNGNVVATIDHVDINNTTRFELRDVDNQLLVFDSPNDTRKDLTIQMTLKTYIQNDVPYFVDGAALRIGNHIWIPFKTVEIQDAIISKLY